MTSAHSTAHWPGNPAPTQLWLGALLRLIAMLASAFATIVRMPLTRLSRECHTDVTPERLPAQDRDFMEMKPAAASGPHDPRHIHAAPPCHLMSCHKTSSHPALAPDDGAPASLMAMLRLRAHIPPAPA